MMVWVGSGCLPKAHVHVFAFTSSSETNYPNFTSKNKTHTLHLCVCACVSDGLVSTSFATFHLVATLRFEFEKKARVSADTAKPQIELKPQRIFVLSLHQAPSDSISIFVYYGQEEAAL